MRELDGIGCLVDRSRVVRFGRRAGKNVRRVNLMYALFDDDATLVVVVLPGAPPSGWARGPARRHHGAPCTSLPLGYR